ncbi:MAG TPA: 4-oxalocrotonate decarboxylase [Acidimicrobiia bacterium]|jgi:2-oxo-3-hexenedioate decarboxylase|nr:4-oxalocrotonate decarboxylase [Acidimicrobiia bacterium]HIL45718.1 4-oxalocrotonate decarboxylase [Acidimicrobiia bacterium]
MIEIQAIAERLDAAQAQATAIDQLAEPLDIAEAYQVQTALLALRVNRGETLTGVKMGFTSAAKREQMGVDDLIFGVLTDAMAIDNGGTTGLTAYVHPRVEPEVAFRLGKTVSGDLSLGEARLAVDAVAPALEIIDSRYRDFKFSLSDVVADNCSSAGYVLGPWQNQTDLLDDTTNLGMVMSVNGQQVQVGSSAAISGNPLQSVIDAARLAKECGAELPAGSILLAGAATAAVPLEANSTVTLAVQHLGEISFRVVGS